MLGMSKSLRLLLVAFMILPGAGLAASTPLAVHIHSDKAMFQVLISPGKAGSDDFCCN